MHADLSDDSNERFSVAAWTRSVWCIVSKFLLSRFIHARTDFCRVRLTCFILLIFFTRENIDQSGRRLNYAIVYIRMSAKPAFGRPVDQFVRFRFLFTPHYSQFTGAI